MMVHTISSNNDMKGAWTSRKGSSSGNGQRQADQGQYPAQEVVIKEAVMVCPHPPQERVQLLLRVRRL